MSEPERMEWDRRYQTGEYRPRTLPSPFLERWLERLPTGRALDVACGTGRNALRLAEAGYRVDAVDISQAAIEKARIEGERRGIPVTWQVVDLDDARLEAAAYDVITVIRYVNRRLWSRLTEALSPNGWLLIEHHLQTTADVGGPSSPEFRLAPQELLQAFHGLRVVHYEEVLETTQGDERGFALARLVACNGDPGW